MFLRTLPSPAAHRCRQSPLVAGIVGDSKFQYDIWGDTVNTAARLESHGAVDAVNISRHTREHLGEATGLHFIPRGLLSVKGSKAMEMFFVEGG